MLVLFETPAGFALFKVLNEGKLSKVEVIIFFTDFNLILLSQELKNLTLTLIFWQNLDAETNIQCSSC